MVGFAPTMWKTAQLQNNAILRNGYQYENRKRAHPNSSNSALVHHRRLSQETAIIQGAAISSGLTLAKRVPVPEHF